MHLKEWSKITLNYSEIQKDLSSAKATDTSSMSKQSTPRCAQEILGTYKCFLDKIRKVMEYFFQGKPGKFLKAAFYFSLKIKQHTNVFFISKPDEKKKKTYKVQIVINFSYNDFSTV